MVDPPRAMSRAMALSKASLVRMSLGRMFFSSRVMIMRPASFARRSLAEDTAGMVPFPGSARPSASIRQFMVLAVNIPAQEPQVGQASSSSLRRSSVVILPAAMLPTASNTDERSTFLPSMSPAIMGPPLMIIEGMFSLAAAMAMPGIILSQFVTRTRPSRA